MSDSLFHFHDLAGQTIVLTGAANGIGRELAFGLARQGCRLWLIDRDAQRLQAVANTIEQASVHSLVGDLSLPAERARISQHICDTAPGIDAIIHNAGIDLRMPLDRMEIDFFRNIMATNVEPAIEITRDLLPLLRASKAGRIILIGSITFEIGTSLLSAYVASKGALVGLTRSLAHELGSDGITVNCIAPGAIAVEKERERGASQGDVAALEEAIVSRQAVKRWHDLLGPVCLLLSQAGGGISGQVLHIDGGLTHPLADRDFQISFVD